MNALPASRVLNADGCLLDDPWHVLRESEGYDHALPTLLPLAAYLNEAPTLRLGVWLAAGDDWQPLKERIDVLSLIAIDFPKSGDGRGYSTATLVRTRLQYRGDLRAIGEILVDQVFMLRRVGFSSFALRGDQSIEVARAALARYSDAYQSAADGRLPAFFRRPAVAA